MSVTTNTLVERAGLTEEELHKAVVSPDHPWGIRLASFEGEFHDVAQAQLAKALWEVADWLDDLEEGKGLDPMEEHYVNRGHGGRVFAGKLQ